MNVIEAGFDIVGWNPFLISIWRGDIYSCQLYEIGSVWCGYYIWRHYIQLMLLFSIEMRMTWNAVCRKCMLKLKLWVVLISPALMCFQVHMGNVAIVILENTQRATDLSRIVISKISETGFSASISQAIMKNN